MAMHLKDLKFIISSDDLVDKNFKAAERLKEVEKDFEIGLSSALTIHKDGPWTTDEICAIKRWYVVEKATNPYLKSTYSIFDVRKTTKEGKFILYTLVMNAKCDSEPFEVPNFSKDYLELKNSPWKSLTSKDEEITMIFTLKNAENYSFGRFNPESIKTLRQSFQDKVLKVHPNLKNYWTGSADYQYYSREGLSRASILNIVMILFLLVACRVLFGKWLSGIIYISTLLIAGVFIYGAKGFFNSPFDVLSNSLFLMLGVAALEDFVFLCYMQMQTKKKWYSIFLSNSFPCFLTALTTILGFLSLFATDLEIIKRLGLWSAVGSAAEWVLLFMLFPAVLKLCPKLRVWTSVEKSYFYGSVNFLKDFKLSRTFARASLLVFLIGGICMFHMNYEDSPFSLFPKKHEFMQALDRVKEQKGSVSSLFVVFPGKSEPEQIETTLQKIAKIPSVSGYENPYDLKNYYLTPETFDYHSQIASEVQSSSIFKQYISVNNQLRSQIFISDANASNIKTIDHEVKNICQGAGCELVGGLLSYYEFTQEMPATLTESFTTSIILVSLVVWATALYVRQGRHIWILLFSSYWGVFLMLIMIVALDIPINFLTCIFASVLIGITGDNAIQYLWSSRKIGLEHGIHDKSGGSVQTALIMSFTSLLFLASYFAPSRVFGVLLFTGLMASLAGDLWILRGLMSPPQNHKKD